MQSLLLHHRVRVGVRQDLEHQQRTLNTATPTQVDATREYVPNFQPSSDTLGVTDELKPESNDESNSQGPDPVLFDGEEDPMNPQNWPAWKKLSTMTIISLVAFIVGFGSSIDSPLIPQGSRRFHVSDVTESLATGLYLIGFGCGAPFAGPISEAVGRSPVYNVTFFLYCIWIMAAALSPNIGAQLVFRFLAGFCGGTPFTTAGGSLSDLYSPAERGKIFPFFAFIAFVGPMIAPVVGGYIGQSGISWRWGDWITLIISGFTLALMVLFPPETYGPIILHYKARALNDHVASHTSKDWSNSTTRPPRYISPLESSSATSSTFLAKLTTALTRPIQLLFTEPILLLFTGYLTLVCAIAFSFFSGYPFIFGLPHNFSQGSTFLMFLGIVFGLILVLLLTPLFAFPISREFRLAAERGLGHPPPEAMLWYALIGGPCLPISLFWMAWTSHHDISYWSPLIASVLFGFSLLTIFISTYAYLINTYTRYAASALVAVTLVRYVIGGAMVVVSIPLYENLGVRAALSMWGGIAVAFAGLPFVLKVLGWGERVRGTGRWARLAMEQGGGGH